MPKMLRYLKAFWRWLAGICPRCGAAWMYGAVACEKCQWEVR